MRRELVITELSVVVVGRNHNPTILNPDFLKINMIVPEEWRLREPPVCADPVAHVVFENGVQILSQPNKIVFTEPFGLDGSGDVETPRIARRYIEAVPHVDYLAVGFNPKGRLDFPTEEESEQWIVDTFLADGVWRNFEGAEPSACVKLAYSLETGRLMINVAHGKIEVHDIEQFVVLFDGNFHRELSGEDTHQRLNDALDKINSWENDVATFRRLVDDKIIGGET